MERKAFLKKGFTALGAMALMPILSACGKEDNDGPDAGACAKYPNVTIGPFPTKNPQGLVMADITADRQGTPLTMALAMKDSATCAAAAGVIVDIWFCDADGNYSQYGGNGQQATNYQSADFLRGRQTTDSEGIVRFTGIYPGWYRGRTTHIHLHAYSASGNSLVVAQIAFPENITSAVYGQGAYAARGQKDTTNARDGIFAVRYGSGTLLDISLAEVAGNAGSGYALTHSISY